MPACSRIQNPSSTGVVSGPPSTSNCTLGTVVGDTSSCSVYYKCENATGSNGTVWNTYTCTNQFFDVISQQCNTTSQARAFPGCNRCQFTTGSMYWANAVDPTCSNYLTCSNGQETKSTPSSCGTGNYFNEALQYCMIGNSTVGQYAQTHGACENYTCNSTTRVCNFITATTTTPSPAANNTTPSPASGSNTAAPGSDTSSPTAGVGADPNSSTTTTTNSTTTTTTPKST